MASGVDKLLMTISAKDDASAVLNGVLGKIKSIGIAYLSWEVVSTAVSSVVKAAAESEAAWNRVEASLKRHNIAVKGNIDVIKNFATEMQRTRGISDELVGEGIQRLVDAGNNLTQSFNISRVAADLAAGTNMDYYSAIELLTKASEGYTSMLSRYGIILDESVPKQKRFQMALAQISQKFGGAAQAEMNTYAGQVKLLAAEWDDFQELLGSAVIPALTGTLKALNDVMQAVNDTPKKLSEGIDLIKENVKAMGTPFLGMQHAFQITTEAAVAANDAAVKLAESHVVQIGKVGPALAEMNKGITDDWETMLGDNAFEMEEYTDHITWVQKRGIDQTMVDWFIAYDAKEKAMEEEERLQKQSYDRQMVILNQFSNAFASNMEQMVMTGRVAWGQMAEDFKRIFVRAVLQAMANQVMSSILNILPGGGGAGKVVSTASPEMITGKRNVNFN